MSMIVSFVFGVSIFRIIYIPKTNNNKNKLIATASIGQRAHSRLIVCFGDAQNCLMLGSYMTFEFSNYYLCSGYEILELSKKVFLPVDIVACA